MELTREEELTKLRAVVRKDTETLESETHLRTMSKIADLSKPDVELIERIVNRLFTGHC